VIVLAKRPLLVVDGEQVSHYVENVGGIAFGKHDIFEVSDSWNGAGRAFEKLADSLNDPLTDLIRRRLGNAIGSTVRGTSRKTGERHTLVKTLAELLFQHHNDTWGVLLPSRYSRTHDRYEIWLSGQLVWSQLIPAAPATQTLLEHLPGGAGVNLSISQTYGWTSIAGVGVVTEAATGTPNTTYCHQASQSTTVSDYSCNTQVDTVNMKTSAAFEYTTVDANNRDIYVGVRYGNGTDAGYRARMRSNTGSYSHAIQRRGGAGGNATLSSPSGDPGATGTQTLQHDGSTLSWVLGAVTGSITATDATLDAQKRGHLGFANGATVTVTTSRLHSDITIADVVSGGAVPVFMNIQRQMRS
jgi:hypothetical protein